jgi:hypothetical protein
MVTYSCDGCGKSDFVLFLVKHDKGVYLGIYKFDPVYLAQNPGKAHIFCSIPCVMKYIESHIGELHASDKSVQA